MPQLGILPTAGPKWHGHFGPWALQSSVISILKKETEMTED